MLSVNIIQNIRAALQTVVFTGYGRDQEYSKVNEKVPKKFALISILWNVKMISIERQMDSEKNTHTLWRTYKSHTKQTLSSKTRTFSYIYIFLYIWKANPTFFISNNIIWKENNIKKMLIQRHRKNLHKFVCMSVFNKQKAPCFVVFFFSCVNAGSLYLRQRDFTKFRSVANKREAIKVTLIWIWIFHMQIIPGGKKCKNKKKVWTNREALTFWYWLTFSF